MSDESIKYEGTEYERNDELKEPYFTESECYIPLKYFIYADEYEGDKYIQREGIQGIFLREITGRKRRIAYKSICQVIVTKPESYAQEGNLTPQDIQVIFKEEDQNWMNIEDINILKPRYVIPLQGLTEEIYHILPQPVPTIFISLFTYKINKLWKELCLKKHNDEIIQEKTRQAFIELDDLYSSIQNEEMTINGSLLGGADSKPIPSANITMTFKDAENTEYSYNLTTDTQGRFTVTHTPEVAGLLIVTTKFEGNTDYDPVTDTLNLAIEEQEEEEEGE